MGWEFHIIDVILTAFVIGLSAAYCCFRELKSHSSALRHLERELAQGNADQQREQLQRFYPSVFHQGQQEQGDEDEILAERLTYIVRSSKKAEQHGTPYSLEEMSEMAHTRLNGRYSVFLLYHVASVLLIAGICGTLWNVSHALGSHTAEDLLNRPDFCLSLWHSMSAIPFTVVLTALHVIYHFRQSFFITRLDLFTAEKLYKLFPPDEQRTFAERLATTLAPLASAELQDDELQSTELAALLKELAGWEHQLKKALEERGAMQLALKKLLSQNMNDIHNVSQTLEALSQFTTTFLSEGEDRTAAWSALASQPQGSAHHIERQTILRTLSEALEEAQKEVLSLKTALLTEMSKRLQEAGNSLRLTMREHRGTRKRQSNVQAAREKLHRRYLEQGNTILLAALSTEQIARSYTETAAFGKEELP